MSLITDTEAAHKKARATYPFTNEQYEFFLKHGIHQKASKESFETRRVDNPIAVLTLGGLVAGAALGAGNPALAAAGGAVGFGLTKLFFKLTLDPLNKATRAMLELAQEQGHAIAGRLAREVTLHEDLPYAAHVHQLEVARKLAAGTTGADSFQSHGSDPRTPAL